MILLFQACILDAIKQDTASGDTGDPTDTACCYGCDADADGYCMSDGDCDDTDPARNPGATETCNGDDDDCDGVIDEGVASTWYADGDRDGFGHASSSSEACAAPHGYVANDTDCDDGDAANYPGNAESCDGRDNNCDAVIDEGVVLYADADGDGYGDPASTSCSATPGWVTNASDCDDAESLAWTGASEICDGVDNDCNGTIDDGLTVAWYLDGDGDGYGNPSIVVYACTPPGAAYVTDGTDPDDADPTVP